MSKIPRTAILILFATLLISLSSGKAQSSAPVGQAASPSAPGAPAPQGTGPYVYYFPVVAKAPPEQDMAISAVKVIQGSSVAGSYAVYIQDRPTTVRTFVSVSGVSGIPGVTARMWVYNQAGTLLGTVNSNAITTSSVESSIASTANFTLQPDSQWLKPGYQYHIQIDPDNSIPETDEGNNRYPASGLAAFDFQYAPPLEVVIVPIMYTPYGYAPPPGQPGYSLPAGASLYETPPPSAFSYLTWMPDKVFPVPSVSYSVHPLVTYTPTGYYENLNYEYGWDMLLNLVHAIHNMGGEDPGWTKLYYGVVNTVDLYGCYGIIGYGFIGKPTAVGWSGCPNGYEDASETMTHEMGHNFYREHVRCWGNESNPDPSYPYADGKIGVWGLDVAAGILKDPNIYTDYMSYCYNQWTSDYTFAGIKQFRDYGSYAIRAMNKQPVQAMYVSGIISKNGQVKLQPVYEQLAPVNLPAGGTHSIELLGADERVVASYPFTPTRIADSDGSTGFGFFVPAADGLSGIRVKQGNRLAGEKIIKNPIAAANFAANAVGAKREARGTALRWTPAAHPTEQVVYRVRVSRDNGATWQVLGLNQAKPELIVQPDLDLTNALVEVQASDGIHVSTRSIKLGKVE